MAVVTEISEDDAPHSAALNDALKSDNAGFFGSLAESIFEPGVNKSLFQAMNFSFLALVLTLLAMAYLTSFNKHVVFLMIVSTGLWLTMIWFVTEITKVQTSSQNAPPSSSDGSIPPFEKPDLVSSQGESSARENVQAQKRTI